MENGREFEQNIKSYFLWSFFFCYSWEVTLSQLFPFREDPISEVNSEMGSSLKGNNLLLLSRLIALQKSQRQVTKVVFLVKVAENLESVISPFKCLAPI